MYVWFITGASRGLGLEIARKALGRGDAVVATARRPEGLRDAIGQEDVERFLPLPLDVTDPAGVSHAVEQAVQRFGRIDVLVNNAGRGIVGAVEEVSDDETRSVFDVNVFGVLTVTRAVLPVMRAQGRGRVIMMSSMGGFSQPGSGWGIYGASKFAVEGFSEALRNEVGPLGIHVTLVEPGVFRTDFLDDSSLSQAAQVLPAYEATSGRTRAYVSPNNHRQQGDPARAAAVVAGLVDQDEPPLRLPLGPDALAAIDTKLAAVAAEVDAARDVAAATSHADET